MKKSLCCFGPGASHSHYVSITPDNRIRLYDTTNGSLVQELAEQSHLAITYTALAWSAKKSHSSSSSSKNNKSNNTGSASKRKRNNNNEETNSGVLALGTDKGHVVIWDLAVGRVVNKLNGHSSAITSLTFGASSNTLFSGASGDKTISQWDTGTGKKVSEVNAGKRGTSWLAVNPSGTRLLVASSAMRLFDLASNERLSKFGKYTQHVRQARFSNNGQLIFSIAPDRISSVYRVDDGSNASSAVAAEPVYNFALPTLPTTMDAQQMGEESEIFHFLSTSEDGSLYVWCWNTTKKDEKTGKRKKKKKNSEAAGVKTHAPDGTSTPNSAVVRARFAGDRIIVASGDPLSPLFSYVEYLDAETEEVGGVKKEIETTASSSSGMLMNGGSDGSTKRSKKSAEESHVSTNTSTTGSMIPVWPAPNSKEDEEDEDEDEEMALMDRVQELEEQLDQSMASTTLPTASTSSATTVTNKNSLIQVLQQALHGNDDALLEHCLGTTNGAIIETTVAGMTPSFVIPFLTRVVAKFEARPARGKLLTSWIQAVIEKHASYIVSTPGVLKTLSGLHETIDARLGAFKRLLKLSGRLDLVLSQMTVMQNQKKKEDDVVGGNNSVARSSFVDNS
jgi:U3 small nucleolar RNA-associated protein 5